MAGFPHSDLAYRALLRNLKLLAGMRGPQQTQFRVFIAGIEAAKVAEQMQKLEKALKIEVGGEDGAAVDALSSRAGEELDAVIVSQPYHVLSSRESLTVAARNALSDEEGTLGLIWHRALPEGSKAASAFTAAVQAAAAKTGPSASGGGLLLPALEQGESPLTWVEKRLALAAGPDGKKPADSSEDGPAGSAANPFLPGCGIPFRPLKHRKFIEAFKPVSAADAAALLKHTHDTCRGAKPSAAVWEAGVASLKSLDKSGVFDADRQQNEREYREGAFSVDLHAFHTSVIPKKAKEVK